MGSSQILRVQSFLLRGRIQRCREISLKVWILSGIVSALYGNVRWMCLRSLRKPPWLWWMLENPFGLLRRYLGHPALIYQPFEYGDDYKKKTCVWGFFKMPKKSPIECTKPKFDKLKTKEIHPEYYGSLTRQERRSLCSPRFAKEFFKANQ